MAASQGPEADEFALAVADVYEAAGALRRYGEQIAATAGQTQARWQLLSVVSVGEWTVPNAADRLGMSRQAVQRVANELVEDGLAVFGDNPHHRRSPFLQLTSAGRSALAAITRQAHKQHRMLAADLDGLDLVRLSADLKQLARATRTRTGEQAGSRLRGLGSAPE